MIRRRRYRCQIVATIAAALIVQACGGSGEAGEPQSPGTAPESLALLVDVDGREDGVLRSEAVAGPDGGPAGDGEGDAAQPGLFAVADPSSRVSSGFGPEVAIEPLTGRPVSDAAAVTRPVLVVKVDNHPRARPQVGLGLADMVFDVRAEGVTRFAAVFQSEVPDPVGPVRSSRTSDFDLLRGFDRPLYASSGGNANVARGLRGLPIVALTNLTHTEYFRDRSRPAPHNLFVNGSDLHALALDDRSAVEPWFSFGPPGRPLGPGARAVNGPVTVSFRGAPVVTHTWDGERAGWLRTQDGAPHFTVDPTDGEQHQLAPENVVIVVTDYRASPADLRSPEVRSTGRGPLVVLTDGRAVAGTWRRSDPGDPLTLLDADGDEITLTPGRTWILMPERGQVSFAGGIDLPGWRP